MEPTKVEMRCVSKKQTVGYSKEYPVQHEIELDIPYDQSSIYFKMSGGTNIKLLTINQDAADMFVIGGKYDLLISPTPVEAPVEEGINAGSGN